MWHCLTTLMSIINRKSNNDKNKIYKDDIKILVFWRVIILFFFNFFCM